MKREVTLEEYFLLRPSDRAEFFGEMVKELNSWEPSLKVKIEELLKLGQNLRFPCGNEAAIDLLSTVSSQEIIHSLRRQFTSKTNEQRDANIEMLVSALVTNYNFHFTTRFETLKYYINNPRYEHSEATHESLASGMSALMGELEDIRDEVLESLRRLGLLSAYAHSVYEEWVP